MILVTDKVTVMIIADTFLKKKHVIELVAQDGVLLSLFSWPVFVGLNGEMIHKLSVSHERDSSEKYWLMRPFVRENWKKKTVRGWFCIS